MIRFGTFLNRINLCEGDFKCPCSRERKLTELMMPALRSSNRRNRSLTSRILAHEAPTQAVRCQVDV
jgi:hypothetical protein